MDNTAPLPQGRPVQQPVVQPTDLVAAQPVAAPAKPQEEQKQPQGQSGSAHKEFGPVASISPSEQAAQPEEQDDEDEIQVARQEVLVSTKVAPVQEVPVSSELKEIGVEQGADTEQEIPVVVQHAGMRVTSSDSAVPVSAIPAVKIPITYAHAVQLDRRSKIKESIKWLARFIKRQWEKIKVAEGEKAEV